MLSKTRLIKVATLVAACLIISVLSVAAEPLCHITINTQASSGTWPSSILKGQSVFDTATIMPDSTGLLKGDFEFYACGPTMSVTPCSSGGTLVSTTALNQNVTSGGAVTVNSANFTPTAAGIYCFRAVFTQTSPGIFPSLTHVGGNPTTQNECVNVIDTPTAVALSSFHAQSGSDNTAIFIGLALLGMLTISGGGVYLARKK